MNLLYHNFRKLKCISFDTETRERNANFGSSLLLANSPMSPKIVNGSFAAIFDNGDNVLEEFARTFSRFRLEVKDSPGKPCTITKTWKQTLPYHC